MKHALTGILLATSVAFSGSVYATETLRAVAALPQNNVITQSFMQYIDIVNETGDGIISIELVGGPEAIPPTQQDTALRNGVVDIQGGPAGYYAGSLPEGEALTGSTVTAAQARENGAFDMLKGVWREKLGAELLAWNGAGTQYHIYLSSEPKFDADGNIDLKGAKLRSAGTYRNWFDALGASNVMMQQSEVFGALERGIVDGFGWISFASDIGVNRLLKTRIDPAVWQGSPVIMMNASRYDALPEDAKKVLQDAAIALEKKIAAEIGGKLAEEDARLTADGVKIVTLEGKAAENYVNLAHDTVWNKLAETAPDFAAGIKPLLYPGH